MPEVLHVAKVYGRNRAFIVLSCGHWVKWSSEGQPLPKLGAALACPTCSLPAVATPDGK